MLAFNNACCSKGYSLIPAHAGFGTCGLNLTTTLGRCSRTHCTGRAPEAVMSPRAPRPGFHSSPAPSSPLLNFSRKLSHIEGLSSLLTAHVVFTPTLPCAWAPILFSHFSLKCLFSPQPPVETLSSPYDSGEHPPFHIHASLCLFTLKCRLFFQLITSRV